MASHHQNPTNQKDPIVFCLLLGLLVPLSEILSLIKIKKKRKGTHLSFALKTLSQTPFTTTHHTTTSPSSKPSTQKDPPIPDTPHHNPSHYNTPTAGPLCGCWFCQCKHLRWVRKEKTKKTVFIFLSFFFITLSAKEPKPFLSFPWEWALVSLTNGRLLDSGLNLL